MTEPEIAGYLTYYHDSALSQTKKVPFYMGENTIGRDPNNKVTIPDSTISKVHAKLVVTPTEMHYIDIGKNGTKVNSNMDESRIVPNQPVSIFTGMTLYLGDMVCKVQRVQAKPTEETLTMARPGILKQKENIVSMLYGSDSEDDVMLNAKNNQKSKEEIKEKNVNNSKTDDQFSLTGDFYINDKKGQDKSKKQKETKRVGMNTKVQKKQAVEDNKKIDQNVRNKKRQKKTSLQKHYWQKQQKQKQVAIKVKDKKIQQKFIIKSPKDDKNQSMQRNTRGSKERQQIKKKSIQKQQKVKKEKQQLRKKQIQKQQKTKKEKEQQKRRQKQQRKKRQKQEIEKKEKQQQQKKIKQQKLRQKSTSLQKPKSKQKKKHSKQKETDAEEGHNNSRRYQKKANASDGQNTKRRITRKRLPTNIISIDPDFYPLRRSFVNRRVLVSGFAPILTKKYFCIVENIEDQFDFLVMKQYKRTFKALYAICRGIHILRFDWIIQSQFLEKTLKPEGYIFKEMNFIYQSIEKVNHGFRVFKGYQFYLGSDDYHLRIEDIEALIYAGGGELMKKIGKLSSKEKEGKNKVAIIRNIQQKTHKLYEQELKRVKKLGFEEIYTIEMILDSCERQQIDWQKNKIK